jgi:flagella basal body P-ring formation protein FlgA
MMIPLLLAVSSSQCLVVREDRVRIADLVNANPGLRELDQNLVVFPSPLIGSVRRLGPVEWRQVPALRGYRMPDLCIQRADRELTREDVVAAIGGQLPVEVEWELIDFSRFRVPEGRVEFLRSDLLRQSPPGASTPTLWRGRVVTEQGEQAAIWARVRMQVQRRVLVAAHELAPGFRLQPDDFVEESRAMFPFGGQEVATESLKRGLEVRRVVAKGTLLAQSMVRPHVAQVKVGQTVRVVVVTGEVRLEMAGTVEMSAKQGTQTWVRLAATGKKLRGMVQPEGTVVVEVSRERVPNAKGMVDGDRNSSCERGVCGASMEKEGGTAAVRD